MEEETITAELVQAYSFFRLSTQAKRSVVQKQWDQVDLEHNKLVTGAGMDSPKYLAAQRHWRTIDAHFREQEMQQWEEDMETAAEKSYRLGESSTPAAVAEIQKELTQNPLPTSTPEYTQSVMIAQSLMCGLVGAIAVPMYMRYAQDAPGELTEYAIVGLCLGFASRLVLEKASAYLYSADQRSREPITKPRTWGREQF